eukprot:5591098-Amphidinium_carterae.2
MFARFRSQCANSQEGSPCPSLTLPAPGVLRRKARTSLGREGKQKYTHVKCGREESKTRASTLLQTAGTPIVEASISDIELREAISLELGSDSISGLDCNGGLSSSSWLKFR